MSRENPEAYPSVAQWGVRRVCSVVLCLCGQYPSYYTLCEKNQEGVGIAKKDAGTFFVFGKQLGPVD